MSDIKKYYLSNSSNFKWGKLNLHFDEDKKNILNDWVIGSNVLDIGCGLGIYSNYLNKRGFTTTGVDFVQEFITYAKRKYNGSFIKGNVYSLPFKNKSFDTTVVFDLLEHLENIDKALSEIKRVTKKRIIICVPKKVEQKLFNIGFIYSNYIDISHKNYFSYKKWKTILDKFRIKVIYKKQIDRISVENLLYLIFKRGNNLKKIIIKVLIKFLGINNYLYTNLIIIGEI